MNIINGASPQCSTVQCRILQFLSGSIKLCSIRTHNWCCTLIGLIIRKTIYQLHFAFRYQIESDQYHDRKGSRYRSKHLVKKNASLCVQNDVFKYWKLDSPFIMLRRFINAYAFKCCLEGLSSHCCSSSVRNDSHKIWTSIKFTIMLMVFTGCQPLSLALIHLLGWRFYQYQLSEYQQNVMSVQHYHYSNVLYFLTSL